MINTEVFLQIARAGGGGSSSGEGDGSAVALLGVPAFFASKFIYKRSNRIIAFAAGMVVGVILTIALAPISGTLAGYTFFASVIGAFVGTRDLLTRIRKKARKNKTAIQKASQLDSSWDENYLRQTVEYVFTKYQADWTNFNIASMQSYLEKNYALHAQLMMVALSQLKRRNLVNDVHIKQIDFVEFNDDQVNSQDKFCVLIEASATDILYDELSEKQVYTDKTGFYEVWHFIRSGKDAGDAYSTEWRLYGITQLTQSQVLLAPQLRAFAQKNGMFYSPDWGWLLLPQRGQLFGKSKFKNSDINNHVIGHWGDLLVQLYTYKPVTNTTKSYIIGQLGLPKSYGGILVLRKSFWSFLRKKPKGYQKVTTEWHEFNKRYKVYATDVDLIASFELINPGFMAWLYDQNLKVNIEVVDSIVYLYADECGKHKEDNYSIMLEVLKRSHKELQL